MSRKYKGNLVREIENNLEDILSGEHTILEEGFEYPQTYCIDNCDIENLKKVKTEEDIKNFVEDLYDCWGVETLEKEYLRGIDKSKVMLIENKDSSSEEFWQAYLKNKIRELANVYFNNDKEMEKFIEDNYCEILKEIEEVIVFLNNTDYYFYIDEDWDCEYCYKSIIKKMEELRKAFEEWK